MSTVDSPKRFNSSRNLGTRFLIRGKAPLGGPGERRDQKQKTQMTELIERVWIGRSAYQLKKSGALLVSAIINEGQMLNLTEHGKIED